MSASAETPAVLLVEDDQSLRTVLVNELGRMGFRVTALPNAAGLGEAVEQHEPEAILLDLHLPGISGMDALAALLRRDSDQQVVVLTGHGTVELAVQAMRRGAFDFLTKPVGLDVLEQSMRRAVASAVLRRENRRLRRAAAANSLAPVPGSSMPARRLEDAIERIARSAQPVLIFGESGAGKEIAARALHAASPRAQKPFVVVNCGAVPRQLMESELFGHLKGAFTGADQKRLGLFEAAHGGTLFLDEVGELPLELQPALLRAIQFGEIRPVGGDQVRKIDVRVVAATHRDLRQWLQLGRFREDLYYRLAVLELRVPPLRERREDIAALAETFLQREAARAGRPLRLTPGALRRLEAYAWPGNVRELENAMVRIAVLADGPDVDETQIADLALGQAAPAPAGPLPTISLRELEHMAIAEAMRRFAGNKRKAAEALGVALKTLYNKLNAGAPPAGDAPDEPS